MKRDVWFLFLIVGGLAAIMLVLGVGRSAPTPPLFDEALTLDQASSRSEQTGRPIFAVVTADWCGPCQSYKRGALSDPAIAELVRSEMVPVYLEESESRDAIGSLPVRAYPTTLIIQGGEVLAMIEGAASASDLKRVIADSRAQP